MKKYIILFLFCLILLLYACGENLLGPIIDNLAGEGEYVPIGSGNFLTYIVEGNSDYS